MADETVQLAVNSNLQGSMYGLMHPGSIAVGSHYAHTESSTLETNILQVRQSTLKIAPSSTVLTSSTNFQVPNRSFLVGFYLSGTIILPQYCMARSSWVYDLINQINISLPGINNLQYSGITMRDCLLRSLSVEQRDALSELMPYIDTSSGAVTAEFVCPLFLPWSRGLRPNTGFYLESGVIANPYDITFDWNPTYEVFWSYDSNTPTYPVAFSKLELKPLTIAESIRPEMTFTQKDIYSLPSVGLQTFKKPMVANTANTEQNIQLQALPVGQIISIFVTAIDTRTIGNSAHSQFSNPVPIEFSYLRLNFNGIDLIEQNTKEIIATGLYSAIDGSDGFTYTTQNGVGLADATPTNYSTRITAMEPTGLDVSATYAGHDAFMSRSFDGQIFQLFYKTTSDAPFLNFTFSYIFNRVYSFQDGSMSVHD